MNVRVRHFDPFSTSIHQLVTQPGAYHPSPFSFRKDADPDIPILKEAKAEYAKLQ
jgi:hypothetical protein